MGGTFGLFFSTQGKLPQRAFVRALLIVYLVALASWAVLSTPIRARYEMFPFAFVHLLLVWCWLALHRKRARDAGRSVRAASVIAVIYALAIVCLLLAIWQTFRVPYVDSADHLMRTEPLGQFYIIYLGYYWSLLFLNTDFDLLALAIKFVALVLAIPVILALGYSIWLARQPTVSEPART